MAYGSGSIDNIITTGNLSIAGNITNQGNITSNINIISGQGTLYPLLSSTAVSTTSGTTNVLITNLPSYVTRISIVFSELSLSGSSRPLIQLGYGSTPTYQTSGYLSTSDNYATTAGPAAASTAGFMVGSTFTANVATATGIYVLNKVPGTNIWLGGLSGTVYSGSVLIGGGTVTLSGVLTAIRLNTVNGTDTYDNGTACVFYE